MSIMAKTRRSKRIFKMNWRHLLIAVGAFLLLSFAQSQPVSARANNLAVSDIKLDALQESQEKIDKLNDAKIVRQDELEEKLDTIKSIETEAKVLSETKKELESDLQDTKAEIADLKAKLEEKKNRTVPEGKIDRDATGNSYAPGNCTWYVKQRRPDIGNFWGNANMWYISAVADGYKTGTLAKTGAIGVTMEGALGHVVYVEKWLGNGKMIISEMNVGGLYNLRTREADESEFQYYIYEL